MHSAISKAGSANSCDGLEFLHGFIQSPLNIVQRILCRAQLAFCCPQIRTEPSSLALRAVSSDLN